SLGLGERGVPGEVAEKGDIDDAVAQAERRADRPCRRDLALVGLAVVHRHGRQVEALTPCQAGDRRRVEPPGQEHQPQPPHARISACHHVLPRSYQRRTAETRTQDARPTRPNASPPDALSLVDRETERIEVVGQKANRSWSAPPRAIVSSSLTT